jgi:hypothetical protein
MTALETDNLAPLRPYLAAVASGVTATEDRNEILAERFKNGSTRQHVWTYR